MQQPVSGEGALIDDIRQVGLHAVQLVFVDGHERGIYPLTYLCVLGQASGKLM